jgi:LDH2 family malate/lactate/ureidoglycolate dehydrogenase
MSETATEPFEQIEISRLEQFGKALLAELKVPAADAALLIDSLIQAELWGHASHGMLRLSWYFERLKSGAMTNVTSPTFAVDSGPLLVIDGHDGIGQVLTNVAVEQAVSRAKQFGVSVVGIRNSNHFGTAMYFTRKAAKQKCIAILTTNASPSMAPWGGSKKVLGNNPWSIAAPFGETVVAMDMANTVVARGKIYAALESGEEIPETWAITKDGKKTTDPASAIDGVILPMGAHKGYAISFMMDVLAGALTGSGIANEVHGPNQPTAKSNAGHLLIVIDVEKMIDPVVFEQRIKKLVNEVKSAPLADGFGEIFYPGEIEDRSKQAALTGGKIQIFQSTRDALNNIGAPFGLSI